MTTGRAADEADFQRRYDASVGGTPLPGTAIEVVREPAGRGRYRHVLFDFDGTLSLIREGWPNVMIGMMVEFLSETGTAESPDELTALVRDYVARLTGKQTIYQMIRLADEVRARGGSPREPLEYKRIYLDRLMQVIHGRREALRSGTASPRDWLVPCALELLEGLRARGLTLYLASGTDEPYVREEAELLGLTPYFGRHVYGALDDYRGTSKAMVIHRLLRENAVHGSLLLGFGDAYVEIDNVKAVGGGAVGVATDEAGRSGRCDDWKRDRLLAVGADLIIADFREHDALLGYLLSASTGARR